MICDWLDHPNHDGHGIVECRRCGEFSSYRLVGYKPEPQKRGCNPSKQRLFFEDFKLVADAMLRHATD